MFSLLYLKIRSTAKLLLKCPQAKMPNHTGLGVLIVLDVLIEFNLFNIVFLSFKFCEFKVFAATDCKSFWSSCRQCIWWRKVESNHSAPATSRGRIEHLLAIVQLSPQSLPNYSRSCRLEYNISISRKLQNVKFFREKITDIC